MAPLKCQTCHQDVNRLGVPLLAAKLQYGGRDISGDYDLAVQWIHANAPDLGGKKPLPPKPVNKIRGAIAFSRPFAAFRKARNAAQ
jgi:hypothetical protein